MLLLVNHMASKLDQFPSPHLGILATPRSLQPPDKTGDYVWAADNDCYAGFDEKRYVRMLERLSVDPSRCKFVSCPDVVAQYLPTLDLFSKWAPVIKSYGLPVALVAQDGLTCDHISFDSLDSIFVGGTTQWKLSAAAAAIVREAKRRGKWVHMGRVSMESRMTYAYNLGVDSVDGSPFARFMNEMLPSALTLLDRLHKQLPTGKVPAHRLLF